MGNWTQQQSAALLRIASWLKAPHGEQVFRLFGFAGTGKTTIAREMQGLNIDVQYAAFTGKASNVLRSKGCANASTVHSLIYKPYRCAATGTTLWTRNGDSPLLDANLLVLDECSMIDDKMADDLFSFGVRILVLGDPAQLPPVGGEGALIKAAPDVMLTEIHRQAADNPIIRMSMAIRENGTLADGVYGESYVGPRDGVNAERVFSADQLLVGRNETRRKYNRTVRLHKGRKSASKPEPGDRLVCLRNNKELGLFNGSLWDVTGADERFGYWRLDLRGEDGRRISTTAWSQPFEGRDLPTEWTWKRKKDHDLFDFGYAITCHKAQGSQWDHVAIRDESDVFRDDRAKWLYTAVTRAADKVTVMR